LDREKSGNPVFDQVRRKNGYFLENHCYDYFSALRANIAHFFRRKYFSNHNNDPQTCKIVLIVLAIDFRSFYQDIMATLF
jgi:hypothetical protein